MHTVSLRRLLVACALSTLLGFAIGYTPLVAGPLAVASTAGAVSAVVVASPEMTPTADALDATCGDGRCSPPEDCNSCARDCGSCCGDRRCAPPEDCRSCPADCGGC